MTIQEMSNHEWYVDIIRDICEAKKIKFEGQSEIYIEIIGKIKFADAVFGKR